MKENFEEVNSYLDLSFEVVQETARNVLKIKVKEIRLTPFLNYWEYVFSLLAV